MSRWPGYICAIVLNIELERRLYFLPDWSLLSTTRWRSSPLLGTKPLAHWHLLYGSSPTYRHQKDVTLFLFFFCSPPSPRVKPVWSAWEVIFSLNEWNTVLLTDLHYLLKHLSLPFEDSTEGKSGWLMQAMWHKTLIHTICGCFRWSDKTNCRIILTNFTCNTFI